MFDLVQNLSKREISEFRAFLNSPFFKFGNKIKEIFEELIKYHPQFDPSRVSYRLLSQKKIGNKKFLESEIRDYVSKLNQKILEFHQLKELRKSGIFKNETLLEILTKRSLEKPFMKVYMDIKNMTGSEGLRQSNYKNEYTAESNYFNFTAIHFPVLKKFEEEDKLKIIENCCSLKSKDYFTTIISDNVTLIINSLEYKPEVEVKIFPSEEFITSLYNELSKKSKDPLLKMYNLFFHTFFKMDNVKNFIRYRDYYYLISDKINIYEKAFHHQNLYKYCLIMMRKGNTIHDFKKESYTLMKHYLEKDLCKVDNEKFLSPIFLLNVIKMTEKKKDFLWLKNYVKNNKEIIVKNDRENIMSFIEVYEHFISGDLVKSLASLSNIKLKHISYKYDVRLIKIRILFELGELQNVIDDINSFEEFLRHDKFLNGDVKRRAGNFLKYVEKLINNALKPNQLMKGYEMLQKDNEVFLKSWLISKYKEKSKLKYL